MASFLSTWRHAIGLDAATIASIRGILSFSQQSRQVVELVPASSKDPDLQLTPWTATIELVDPDASCVISQPSQGAMIHPLTTGERLSMTARGPEGRYRGDVLVKGRATLDSGAGGKFYGYRLAPLGDLVLDERRFRHRLILGFDICLLATIEPFVNPGEPQAFRRFRADITDVSLRGMRLRTPTPPEGLRSGMVIWIETELPDPVVTLRLRAMVRHAAPTRRKDSFVIGAEFDAEVDSLNEFIRRVQIRRRRRNYR